jgi:bifunctional non-homologous end joining protein LigD
VSAKSPEDEPLQRYRDKRSASRTPEPFGSAANPRASGPLVFVVQKHAARRLHYDLRLQIGDVLQSWAIPHGPTLDPGAKRLAIEVESHPLEYADFEGVIPEGNYGAGTVVVWDRGLWRPLVDPEEGFAAGDLKFELVGYKLRGEFALVRTGGRKKSAGNEKQWLLIKKRDRFADPAAELPEASILSGLTVEHIASARDRARAMRGVLEDLGARPGTVDPREVRLALCQVREQPFSDPEYLYELKYDGYRLVAGLERGEPVLRYRSGHLATASFPEITAALRALPFDDLVLDGELVCFDESGKSEFGRLQRRAMLTRGRDVEQARIELPATLVAFDLLALEGLDTRPLPLEVRKEILGQLLPRAGVVRYCDHILERGEELYARIQDLDLEGMIAKRRDSPYRAGRLPTWQKIRLNRIDEFAVVGWRRSKKDRTGFGALHLAVRDGDRWLYAGRVGGGFAEDELIEIRARLEALPRARYNFDQATSRDTWVEPALVAVVRYKEWPASRTHIREPTFLHLREDKSPLDCHRPVIHGDAPDQPAVIEAPAPGEPRAAITNPKKLFWPDDGITKGDLIGYYRRIAPWLLPYLRDRPLVLTRYPDGIAGKSFFQKDAPKWAPEWMRTETVWSEHSQREIHYFIVEDEDGLIYLANLGTIPLHIWCSRTADLAHPDWCIIDLDPKGAPFSDVALLAVAIRELTETIGLPATLKTSGSTGLHILIPLGGQCTYDQSRQLAGLISQIVVDEHPRAATLNRSIESREGKVYLDWLQNRHGQLLVAPFSARPLPGAPVSMPLAWSELEPDLDFHRFTIATAPERMEALGRDPMAAVLVERPDLLAALERLEERLRDRGGSGGDPVA